MTDGETVSFRGETIAFDPTTVPRPVVESIVTADLFDVERRSLGIIVSELRADDVFFDVGAMYGLYTGFAGQRLTEGSIVAFEPYPRNLEALERTIELNGLSNVDVRDVALGTTNGVEEFESPSLEYHVRQQALRKRRSRRATESSIPDADSSVVTFSVETRVGDDLVQAGALPRPNVVKIDVEGAEPVVVDGLSETLAREECRLLVCEIHPPARDDDDTREHNAESTLVDYGSTVAGFVDEVERLGFETELDHGDGYIHLRGRK